MDCSQLRGYTYDQPPWVMLRDDKRIQVEFGLGSSGFIVLTRAEADALLESIRHEGKVTICNEKLSDRQARELVIVLEKLLSALW